MLVGMEATHLTVHGPGAANRPVSDDCVPRAVVRYFPIVRRTNTNLDSGSNVRIPRRFRNDAGQVVSPAQTSPQPHEVRAELGAMALGRLIVPTYLRH